MNKLIVSALTLALSASAFAADEQTDKKKAAAPLTTETGVGGDLLTPTNVGIGAAVVAGAVALSSGGGGGGGDNRGGTGTTGTTGTTR